MKNNIEVAVKETLSNKMVISVMEEWNTEEIQIVQKTIENDTSSPDLDIDIAISA